MKDDCAIPNPPASPVTRWAGGWGHPRQEHRPQRPTEHSDPTQYAKGRTGDCPGPRKETTTRRNVTQGGYPAPPPPSASGGGPIQKANTYVHSVHSVRGFGRAPGGRMLPAPSQPLHRLREGPPREWPSRGRPMTTPDVMACPSRSDMPIVSGRRIEFRWEPAPYHLPLCNVCSGRTWNSVGASYIPCPNQ